MANPTASTVNDDNLPRKDEVSLPVAVWRLRMSYQDVRYRVLRGELSGRLIRGRWFLREADVARLEAQRAQVAQPA
jgi:hypothetical protein